MTYARTVVDISHVTERFRLITSSKSILCNLGNKMRFRVLMAASMTMSVFWDIASTSETSVNFYQTIWRNIPEDSHLHR
jgi:hypothetical protein